MTQKKKSKAEHINNRKTWGMLTHFSRDNTEVQLYT